MFTCEVSINKYNTHREEFVLSSHYRRFFFERSLIWCFGKVRIRPIQDCWIYVSKAYSQFQYCIFLDHRRFCPSARMTWFCKFIDMILKYWIKYPEYFFNIFQYFTLSIFLYPLYYLFLLICRSTFMLV